MNPNILAKATSLVADLQRLTLYGVSWQQYEIIRATNANTPVSSVRILGIIKLSAIATATAHNSLELVKITNK